MNYAGSANFFFAILLIFSLDLVIVESQKTEGADFNFMVTTSVRL